MQTDGGGAEGIGLDDIGAGLEILAVNFLYDVGLSQLKQFEATFEILAFPIVEAFPAILLFGQLVTLNHGAHGAIEDDDALAEQAFDRV